MGNPAHIQLLNAGEAALREWRAANPGAPLDFSAENFAGRDFKNWDLSGANFISANLSSANFIAASLQGANLTRANLTAARLTNANCKNSVFDEAILDNAKVKGTDFHEARFVRASLTGTNLRSARLAGASFEQASLHHFNLSRCDLTRTRFHSSKLSGADLSEARLGRSDLQACDLSEANLDGALLDEANLASADLSRASLVGASIRNANLTSANYTDANLSRADLLESDVSNVNFNRTRGLTRAENLLTVRVSDVRYFDFAIIPAPERLLSWERIRWLGRLPLFGASYSALIAIPFLYYLLDMFNRRVEVFRAWATQELANSGTHTTTARVVLDHVHREPIPSLSLCLLISTFLLGVGATIFALSCPPRVREFSREQWRDELGHSLIHYLPFAWHHRWLRMACVICYAIGGIGVIFVVASKLWNVFWFIVDNM